MSVLNGNSVLPFAPATRIGDTLYVSGQGGIHPETGQIVDEGLEAQTIQTMNNLLAILNEHGLDFPDVKKVNVYLTRLEDYQTFNRVYASFFSDTYPARTTVYCDLNYNLLVEIDIIAHFS